MNKKAYLNNDFIKSDSARSIRILSEFVYPQTEFQRQNIIDTIVFFGSARIRPADELEKKIQDAEKLEAGSRQVRYLKNSRTLSKYYEDAVQLAFLITKWSKEICEERNEKRFLICTGGGPGIMEAGSKGAKLAGGQSIALNISLPFEQTPNPYNDPDLSFEFHYFFMRKLWFIQMAKAAIVFPGGFGTIDELFEILTLIQTEKNKTQIPVFLYGSEFWKKVIQIDFLVENNLISEEDLDLFNYVDTPESAFELLQKKLKL